MSLEVLNAYIQGYSDHITDLQILAATTGYWSGYYNNAKHPVKLSKVVANIYKAHKRSSNNIKPKADIDVEAFLKQEARFQKNLMKGGSVDG